MFGFVGPNGAGKTTAMRIILGVLSADRGEVRWRGAPVDAEPAPASATCRRSAGCIRRCASAPSSTYLAALHGVDAAEASADRWIERLGLSERADDRVEELSLGNQQRVQLAAALVHEPELLVLDEPFSGLDPTGVDVLSGVLSEYAATGVPVVFSSHQLELVERLCEAVAIIKDGRLVASGTVEELRGQGTGAVRVIVEGAPDFAVRGANVLDRGPRGVVFEGAEPDAVLDAARAAGRVTYFALERPTLTDLFREAVK